MKKERKIANRIINEFEELLDKNKIKIPNKERENDKEESCIYGSDYYELEDKITKILDRFKKSNIIKAKLRKWLESIKIERNPETMISQFEKLFKNKYKTKYESDIEEYYESYTTTFILDNKIEMTIVTGPWDKFGSQVSHVGTDIHIFSKNSNIEEYRNGITIFSYGEYQEKSIKDLEKLLTEELEYKE